MKGRVVAKSLLGCGPAQAVRSAAVVSRPKGPERSRCIATHPRWRGDERHAKVQAVGRRCRLGAEGKFSFGARRHWRDAAANIDRLLVKCAPLVKGQRRYGDRRAATTCSRPTISQ